MALSAHFLFINLTILNDTVSLYYYHIQSCGLILLNSVHINNSHKAGMWLVCLFVCLSSQDYSVNGVFLLMPMLYNPLECFQLIHGGHTTVYMHIQYSAKV